VTGVAYRYRGSFGSCLSSRAALRSVRFGSVRRGRVRDVPHEAGELASDGDVDEVGVLALVEHAPLPQREATQGAIGKRDCLGRLLPASQSQGSANDRLVGVVPGGFDQQPTHVTVAGPGDAAASLAHAAGVLARDQSQVRHQLARVREALGVVDLGDQCDGSHRVDAMEAAERLNPFAPRWPLSDRLDLFVQALEPTFDLFDGEQVVLEHDLVGTPRERQRPQPRPILGRPRRLAAHHVHAAATQQELAQPVAGLSEITLRVIP